MAGLYVAVASQRSQMAVQIMIQYSDKFRNMFQGMPAEMIALRHGRVEGTESTPELSRHILSIFYVLLELHYLREKRYLPMSIWDLWLPSLRGLIGSPFVVSEWQRLRVDFVSHPAYCRFVDSLQK
jgi:hypothetical protein